MALGVRPALEASSSCVSPTASRSRLSLSPNDSPCSTSTLYHSSAPAPRRWPVLIRMVSAAASCRKTPTVELLGQCVGAVDGVDSPRDAD